VEDIDSLHFNTAIAYLMELINDFSKLNSIQNKDLIYYALERFAFLIAPLAPHLGEECWSLLGKERSLFENPIWFDYDENALVQETFTLAVQVNGKLRAAIEFEVNASEEEIKSKSKEDSRVKKFIEGKNIVKEIYVPKKILNIVVK